MKVAILSSIAWSTPPKKYGPWQQVASNVAEGLIEKGIDVTLFATADSSTKGKLEYICEKAYEEDFETDAKVSECLHIGHLMENADKFDIIHNHFDFLPLSYSRLINTPMLTTIHGFSSPKIIPVYKKYNSSSFYVSISNSDRSPELDYIATIYNGIDTGLFTFRPSSDNYLLFFGRIHPEKGTYEAVQIAKQVGMKLIISGFIQDQDYFNMKIKPYLNDSDIIYAGNSGPVRRNELLGGAVALLHLISFDEPFGLSVAEAMLCGTPVIAFNRGSMPELIKDKETGFLVNTLDEARDAVNQISLIDPMNCRKHAISNFSKEKMADEYLKVYEKILRMGKK